MKKQPRVLIAGLFHETHTLLPGETNLANCAVLEGENLLLAEGDSSPLGGALEVARQLGWDVIPGIDIRAIPGPICTDEIVDLWWSKIDELLNQAKLDGVFLVLHGAMVSRSLDDVEGEILERVRAIVGPEIPIGGVTDLHTNFSARMAQNSNSLVTYRENPHTDARETAKRSALLLDFLLRSDEKATTYFRQVPVLWPPTGTATGDQPMRRLKTLARKIEKEDAEILAVNVHAGYSFSDIYNAGVSFSIVSVGDEAKAQKALDKLEVLALDNMEEGNVIEPTFETLLPQIRGLLARPEGGPVVLAEPSDNIGGGAPGDGTGLLREFLKHNIGRSAVAIADPAAVKSLGTTAIGNTRVITLGGGSNFPGAGPIELEVELIFRSEGHFELEDSQSHLASMNGQHIEMGQCVTLRHVLPNGEGILILLTSLPTPPFDLGQLRSQGIEPEALQVIGVKAAVAHRRAYEPIAGALLSIATPGPCASDLKTLPFKKVRRPIFPLDTIQ